MGSVPPALLAEVIQEARRRGTVVVADSRKALLSYAGVNVVTPNEEEVEAALQIDPDGLEEQLGEAGARLLEALSCDAVLITRGSRGMALFEAGANGVQLAIHGTDEIADVTGAGDAVIATLTTALVVGATMLEAARLANVAAGLAVMKRGTATVPTEELRAALEQGAEAAR
jgi:rfaE bifunctional protein kinase chain/domain